MPLLTALAVIFKTDSYKYSAPTEPGRSVF
jgi:hypothetical protein